jgi:hypothetical protein
MFLCKLQMMQFLAWRDYTINKSYSVHNISSELLLQLKALTDTQESGPRSSLCFKGIDQADDTIKVDSGKKLPLSLRK